MRKYKKYAGADEKTPSIPQYFSWINNTNEGSTEKQTLTNLAFFKYMHGVFGMQLRIYAWDAGNFDGASGTYGDIKSPVLNPAFCRMQDIIVDVEPLPFVPAMWTNLSFCSGLPSRPRSSRGTM